MIHEKTRQLLNTGVVIPALPLALDRNRKLDEVRQRALLRYYLDAGAGGVAVAVHTTQFAIRDPRINLHKPLLKIADEEFSRFTENTSKPVIRIAGVTGRTKQALKETEAASACNFDIALLSVAAFSNDSNKIILKHCRDIAKLMPVMGFYLQPAVGGRKLNADFWREFAAIENVIAIKIAPFNRYQTLDVVRGVVESGRADQIALYTGNDDNILADLLTEYRIVHNGKVFSKKIVGGLLGHWAVWTHTAVKLLKEVQNGVYRDDTMKALTMAARITDCNAAFFDAANNFRGCITGLHEVLRRQGLLRGLWTLDRDEKLFKGQKAEIDRVYSAYPDLNDDIFVKENLARWLS